MADATAPDGPAVTPLVHVRERVDPVLELFLADREAELAAMDPDAAILVGEIRRLVGAGGKRIRPALCYWAFRAAGGSDEGPVVRAAAGLELLHTFALVHDDVMDRSDERRGVPATHAWFAKQAPPGIDPDAFGQAAAILVGDLAAVLAERLFRACGAAAPRLADALSRFDRMRAEMAAGQFLDLLGLGGGRAPGHVAALKTGSYTADGPVSIGAALAGAAPGAEGPLRVYAGHVGRAFQLRDDVVDGEAGADAAAEVDALVRRAREALRGAPLAGAGARALDELAALLRLGAAGG